MRAETDFDRIPGPHSQARLEEARRLARFLDAAFTIPGTNVRVGIDPILSLLPGLGDVVASALGSYLLVVAWRLGAPASVVARMALNLLADAALGAVPVLGDVGDVFFRANLRNARLLEEWTVAPTRARRASLLVVALAIAVVLAVVAAIAFAAWSMIAWGVGALQGGAATPG